MDRRIIDIRTINGPFTPKDEWFTTQHYGHPKVDAATHQLKVSGLVDRPLTLSIDDLRKIGSKELVAGFECSGNRGPLQGLSSNARWTGVPLKDLLDKAGVKASAREFVFFGADRGEEEVEWRNDKFKVQQQFGRALTREKALSSEPMLVWALNGDPLTLHQGMPLRLLVPGWYGVASVKWLCRVEVLDRPFQGYFQSTKYTIQRPAAGGLETVAVGPMAVKAEVVGGPFRKGLVSGLDALVTVSRRKDLNPGPLRGSSLPPANARRRRPRR